MAIDPRIALGVQPFQLPAPPKDNRLNMLAQVMQLRDAESAHKLNSLKIQEAERGVTETNSLNEAYRTALSPDGSVDRTRLYGDLATRGLGSRIPDIQKKFFDADKAKFDVQKAAFEGYKNFQLTLGSHATNPNLTKQEVLGSVAALVQSGSFDGPTAQKLVANLPDDPQQLRVALQQILKSQMTPEQMLTVFAPKPTQVDNGQQIGFRDTNPNSPTYGQTTAGAPVQKLMTPGEVASDKRGWAQLNEQKRHHGVTENQAGQAVTYQQDANGNFVALPSKVAPGTVVRAMPVAAPGGGLQPLGGKPSESTQKELVNIRQQNAIIDGAIAAVDSTPTAFSFGRGVATMAGAIPESLAGRRDSDAERQARSYVFNNVSKVINERAGAAQSAQELARLRSFLPAETDNADQIKSKLQAFKTYLSDMEAGTRGTPAAPAPAAAPKAGFADPGKEQRYQEWKRRQQGGKP